MSVSKQSVLDAMKAYHQKLLTLLAAKYVAQEDGMGLSSNDYTTTEKNQLATLVATGGSTEEITPDDINSIFGDSASEPTEGTGSTEETDTGTEETSGGDTSSDTEQTTEPTTENSTADAEA